MDKRKKINWDLIEPDWRAGVKTVSQMAREYTVKTGVSICYQAIQKHFNKEEVPRDLFSRVHAKAAAIIEMESVKKEKREAAKESDEIIVNENAAILASIQLAHRKDIARARALTMQLLSELENMTNDKDLFSKIREIVEGGFSPKMMEVYDKAVQFPVRVDNMKKLADTLKSLIDKERQAFGLKDDYREDVDDSNCRIVSFLNFTKLQDVINGF